MHGFDNVGTAEKAYRIAKAELDTVRRKQAEWDGVPVSFVPQKRTSVLKELAAKQAEVHSNTSKNNAVRRGRKTGVEL